jgi:2-oxoisovalerate dehydrogenase E1 component
MCSRQGELNSNRTGLISDEIQRRYLDWLDQPVMRVHGGEASPSISKVLERAAIAGQSEVERGLREVMLNRGTPV